MLNEKLRKFNAQALIWKCRPLATHRFDKMKYLAHYLLALSLLPAPSGLAAAAGMSVGKTGARFDTVIDAMAKAAASMQDAVYVFHKQEYVDGEQRAAERMAVRFRAPNDFYLTWRGPVHQGRELLFRPGWNGDRLRVSPGRWLPTLNLDPRGALAMHGNRHSIFELPFPAIVQNFSDSAALLRANPVLQAHVTDLGEQSRLGDIVHCYHLQLPKRQEPRLYAMETELCVSLRTGLPVTIRNWDVEDGALRLVEDYGYEGVQVNVGLTDLDFDPDNPAYGF